MRWSPGRRARCIGRLAGISDRTEWFSQRRAGARDAHHRGTGPRSRAQIHCPSVALGREPRRLRHRPLRWPVGNIGGTAGVYHIPTMYAEAPAFYASSRYRADRGVSWRWAAEGYLHDRTHHRYCRARTRYQPVSVAPHQPDPARGDAVQDRAHLHLRLRRIRRQHAEGLRDGRARWIRGAARRGEIARQARGIGLCNCIEVAAVVPLPARIRPLCAWRKMAHWCCAPARCRSGRGLRLHSASLVAERFGVPLDNVNATRRVTPICCRAAKAMAARARCASAGRR